MPPAGFGWRLARAREARSRPLPGGTDISAQVGPPPDGAGLAGAAADAAGRATFSQVFGVGEFRALWLAQVLSVGGDQLARVALTILVFGRTHSALLAALTFAASVVPTFVGAISLSGLADRFPRRAVMIACDLVRAALVVVMALPGIPLAVLVCLLFAVTAVGAPFTSARAALYPDILAGDRFVLGNAITLTTSQVVQVAGFAAGGVAVALLGTRNCLLVDAATFLASALLVVTLVRARPAAARGPGAASTTLASVRSGLRLVFRDPRLRLPMLLGWLAAFYMVPEGIAVPLARDLGGGDTWVGFILAAEAFGYAAGAIVFSRFVPPARRLAVMAPLAAATCGVLVLFAAGPALPAALVILAVSGVFGCYQVAASAAFVTAAPPAQRAQAFGVAEAGIALGQGGAMVIAGAVAQAVTPSAVIAASGALGVLAAGLLAAAHRGRQGRAG